jgi:hypothetical protein
MNVYVLYKYRAPGSSETYDFKVESWAPEKVLRLTPSVGEATPLVSDYPEEFGDQEKLYRVVERQLAPTDEHGRVLDNQVVIVVTDANSE